MGKKDSDAQAVDLLFVTLRDNLAWPLVQVCLYLTASVVSCLAYVIKNARKVIGV